jgi:hypothetical protein
MSETSTIEARTKPMKTRALITVMACFAFLLISVGRAKADSTVNFTVTINSGSESGDVFTGSYTYNALDEMTSFAFTDPNWNPAAFPGNTPAWNGSGQGWAYFQLTDPTNWMVWYNQNLGTPDDSFTFGSADLYPDTFLYGTSNSPSDPSCTGAGCFLDDGSGTVTYNTVATTPEPGTIALFGTGLSGFLGLIRRRRKA